MPEEGGECLKRLEVVERLLAELPANCSYYTILYYLLALLEKRKEEEPGGRGGLFIPVHIIWPHYSSGYRSHRSHRAHKSCGTSSGAVELNIRIH